MHRLASLFWVAWAKVQACSFGVRPLSQGRFFCGSLGPTGRLWEDTHTQSHTHIYIYTIIHILFRFGAFHFMILYIKIYKFQCHSVSLQSIPFHSIPFHSLPFPSIPFHFLPSLRSFVRSLVPSFLCYPLFICSFALIRDAFSWVYKSIRCIHTIPDFKLGWRWADNQQSISTLVFTVRMELSKVTGGERVALEAKVIRSSTAAKLATARFDQAPFDRTEPSGLALPAPRLILAEFLSSGRQAGRPSGRPPVLGCLGTTPTSSKKGLSVRVCVKIGHPKFW